MGTPESTPEQIQAEWIVGMQKAHGKPMQVASEEERRAGIVEALHRERGGVEVKLRQATATGEQRVMVRDLRSETGFRYRSGPEMVAEQEERLRGIDAEIARLTREGE